MMDGMSDAVTLFHDLTSPAAAVAVMRLTSLAVDGVPIAFEGFEAIGIDMAMPVDLDTLAVIDRLAPVAEAEGLVLRRPRTLPPTGLAHVLLAHGETTERAHELRIAVYRAFWEQQQAIDDIDTLVAIAADVGLDEPTVAELLGDRVALASRRRLMATHRRDGVGGVPVILASRTLVPGLLDADQVRALAAAV